MQLIEIIISYWSYASKIPCGKVENVEANFPAIAAASLTLLW